MGCAGEHRVRYVPVVRGCYTTSLLNMCAKHGHAGMAQQAKPGLRAQSSHHTAASNSPVQQCVGKQ
jgi:hypothetical protein